MADHSEMIAQLLRYVTSSSHDAGAKGWKIGVVSGVISSTESESEESERSGANYPSGTVPFSSDSAYDCDAYDLVKTRLSESQAEAEEPTNDNAVFILWLPLTTPTI